ncbi:MAG: cytochrome b N-terminal domain-containing protein [Candidatus Tectomicrobia bacterium]|nr:cytochrome b N-terminal domain-containing protein [Candidatus Tectomicrobia bacterium]
MNRVKDWKRVISESFIWRSVFRHGYPDTRRNKMLAVSTNVFLHLHPTKIKERAYQVRFTWCMGGISFFLFLVLTVTGLLLMFYYVPDSRRAYDDMKDLTFVVPFGSVLRNLHRWGAHAMVLSVIAHMARVFYTGSYKPPREFNWVVGVILLVFTLLLSFSGYLLPWDQLSMWAVTVGTNMARATPFLGHEGPFANVLGMAINNDARFVLLGGTIVSQSALLRFYVWHCVGFPLILVVFLSIHFWRIRKDGFSGNL